MFETLKNPKTYAKAGAAGLTALIGALGTSMADGKLDEVEILASLGVAIVAFGTVFQTPNKAE
ncbi:hypothetical protein [Actinocorallia libanotica]|uniref:Holin n=1 Tax=Actinocorallia libanotica TaxID=46162 RepID=A0ABN1Q2Z4_9ACTN